MPLPYDVVVPEKVTSRWTAAGDGVNGDVERLVVVVLMALRLVLSGDADISKSLSSLNDRKETEIVDVSCCCCGGGSCGDPWIVPGGGSTVVANVLALRSSPTTAKSLLLSKYSCWYSLELAKNELAPRFVVSRLLLSLLLLSRDDAAPAAAAVTVAKGVDVIVAVLLEELEIVVNDDIVAVLLCGLTTIPPPGCGGEVVT